MPVDQVWWQKHSARAPDRGGLLHGTATELACLSTVADRTKWQPRERHDSSRGRQQHELFPEGYPNIGWCLATDPGCPERLGDPVDAHARAAVQQAKDDPALRDVLDDAWPIDHGQDIGDGGQDGVRAHRTSDPGRRVDAVLDWQHRSLWPDKRRQRSEEHTSELQSHSFISYA